MILTKEGVQGNEDSEDKEDRQQLTLDFNIQGSVVQRSNSCEIAEWNFLLQNRIWRQCG